MELKIDRGLKSYEVKDIDGTLLGTLYVNPADIGIAARLEEARRAIQQLADGLAADAGVDQIIEADKLIRSTTSSVAMLPRCSSKGFLPWRCSRTAPWSLRKPSRQQSPLLRTRSARPSKPARSVCRNTLVST